MDGCSRPWEDQFISWSCNGWMDGAGLGNISLYHGLVMDGWMEQALGRLVYIMVFFQTTAEQQIEEQRIRFKKVNP